MKRPIERLQAIAKRHRKAPGDVTIAVDRPMQIGEVLLIAGFRFAVSEELTREEFLRRVAENKIRREAQEREMGVDPGNFAGITFATQGAAVEAGTDEISEEPPEVGHYYAMRRLP